MPACTPNKSGWWIVVSLVPFVGGIILIVLLAIAGTPGPNRFGAQPPPRVPVEARSPSFTGVQDQPSGAPGGAAVPGWRAGMRRVKKSATMDISASRARAVRRPSTRACWFSATMAFVAF